MESILINQNYRHFFISMEQILKDLQQLTLGLGDGSLMTLSVNISDSLRKPFLFVVIGEVKAGKSSFINALLSTDVCRVDPAPCTDTIQEIIFSEESFQETINPYLKKIGLPRDILRDISVVDTPGTNTIIDHHQEVTETYLPGSDLVIFVFSAKNPYNRTAWELLEHIKDEWRKRVIFVLQQADLTSPEELHVNLDQVVQQAQKSGVDKPRIFALSAKREAEGDPESGFREIREMIRNEITGDRHHILKLHSIAESVNSLMGQITGEITLYQEQLKEDQDLVVWIQERLTGGAEQSSYEIDSLVDRLLATYALVADEIREKFKAQLSFMTLLKRTFSFKKKESIKGIVEQLQQQFSRKLNERLKQTAVEGAEYFVRGVRELLKGMRRELESVKSRYDHYDLEDQLSGSREELIDDVIQKLSGLLQDDAFIAALKSDPDTIAPTVLKGGALAVIGSVLLSTHIYALDITGGILTGIGTLLSFGVLFFKKDRVIKEFEEEIKQHRKRYKEVVAEQLNRRLKEIYRNIDQHFKPLYDHVIKNEKNILPVIENFEKTQNQFNLLKEDIKNI